MTVVSYQEYRELKARCDAFEAWRGERRSYRPEEIPADVPRVNNEDRSKIELFEFVNDKPTHYFLYVNADKCIATNFMGDFLGRVEFGRAWRDNFGGMRVAIRIHHAINGVKYAGTCFKSAGNYARVKAVKS